VVAGADDAGAFYGMQSLRQLIHGREIDRAQVRDWPFTPFRGIFMYLPGRENIGYFKRFLNDFMALYKYNRIILEMNAAMRLDRHPELNEGWLAFGKDMNYTRRERSPGPGRQFQDSANADTGDFGVLEKDEVADLVRYAAEQHIEIIPEIPTLTHSYCLLTRHRELAEIADAEWPDTYCPSEPKVYPLVFDVIDEFLDVMKPRMVHIGHDEWRMPIGMCARCRGKSETELFAADVNRIYQHLKSRNVRTAMWGDHFIEPLRGKQTKHVSNPRGTPYDTPGALSPEQVRRLIPKDILIFNWFWNEDKRIGSGEANEIALREWGFEEVFANFRPDIADFDRRSTPKGMLGGAPSAWAATTELTFGKDMMFDFLGCANLLWSTARPDARQLSETVQGLLPVIRRRLSATPFPSDAEPAVETSATQIGEDVSSIIFVHSSAKPGRNRSAYYATWNYADSADLLGWYEVVYQDGFVASVPIRYGINILETGWGKGHRPESVAYEAELVERGAQSWFSYEWINPRFGKPVKEVRLHQAKADNPVTLTAVKIVKKRVPPEPKLLGLLQPEGRKP
jgi:hexosaminidase